MGEEENNNGGDGQGSEREKYRALFENSITALFITQPDGAILEANNAACEMFGYSVDEFRQLGRQGVIDPKTPGLEKRLKEREKTGSTKGELVGIRKGGEHFWCEFSSTIFTGTDGKKLSSVLMFDISDRKLAEERLKSVTNNVPGVVFRYVLYPDNKDGLQFVSDGAKEIWGVESSEAMGDNTTVWNHFHKDDIKEVFQSINKSAENFSQWFKEWRYHHPEKGLRWHRGTGNPVRLDDGSIAWDSLVLDVTEENSARKQLEESKERYEFVTKATSDAIWDFVPATGDLFWGEGFKNLFGYERYSGDRGIDKWMKHIHPRDIERVQKGVRELLKGDDNHWNEEYRFKRDDGSYAFVHDKAIVVRDKYGNTQRVVGAMEDITQRKQEEQQLKLMESVVTNAGDSVLITKAEPFDEPDGPEIVYVNEAFEKMTGYKANEVIGKTPRILQGPNTDYEKLEELGRKIRRWEPATVETINYKKNGEEFWINFSVKPVANEKGWYTHWISVERDVTERKNQELKQRLLSKIGSIFNETAGLRDSLKKMLQYVKSYGNFTLAEFWVADHDRNIIDLVVQVDEGLEQFYNNTDSIKSLKRGEGLPGRTWKSGETQFWKNLHKRKSSIRREAAATEGIKTGYGFPVKYNEEVIGVLIIAVKDTPKKPQYFAFIFDEILNLLGEEIRRKELEEELSRIFSSAPDGIIVAGFDGYYKKVNPAMSEILGYSEEELLDSPFIEFIHPDDRDKTLEMYEEANSGANKYYFENRYITKSGQVVWLSWSFKVFFDEGVAYSVAKNITDQKIAEKQLKELNESLEQQTKELAVSNAELEQFAFVASHDLQEPLRMITSFLAQLERKYNDVLDEKGKKYIYFASDGAKRMRQIILDLLEYSRVSKVESEKEEVQVEEVLRNVVTLHRRIIDEKNAKISWKNLPVVYAAKGPLQQLFQNLMSNSLHYHEKGNEPIIKIKAEEAGSHWKFFVTDNGIGINPEYAEKIFNIFQRLHGKEEYSGTGVGLSICKKIVEDHGGSIWVESQEGKGSTFIFTIAKPQKK